MQETRLRHAFLLVAGSGTQLSVEAVLYEAFVYTALYKINIMLVFAVLLCKRKVLSCVTMQSKFYNFVERAFQLSNFYYGDFDHSDLWRRGLIV